jgi:hypothetical protein
MPVCTLFFRPVISRRTLCSEKFSPFAGGLTLGLSALQASAQTGADEACLTVTIDPDGSRTVYQEDSLGRQAIATTTGSDGRPRGKITYPLDSKGRYESGQVFAARALFVSRLSMDTRRLDASRRKRSVATAQSAQKQIHHRFSSSFRLLVRLVPSPLASAGKESYQVNA